MVIHGHESHGGRRSARTVEAIVKAQSRDSHRHNKQRAERGNAFDRACNFLDRLFDGSTTKGRKGR